MSVDDDEAEPLDEDDVPDEEDAVLEGTVLVVDDEDEIVANISRLLALRFPSVRVITANGGPLALKILNVIEPDVVVSDYVMPGMSGLVLLGIVQSRHPATFRILMSAYAASAPYTRAVRTRTIDMLLQKPAVISRIGEAVRQGLGVAAQRRARGSSVLHAHGDVLLVGEGPELAEVIEDHLRDGIAHVNVRGAPSATAALEALGKHPADVILADSHLPDMTGEEFLARAHRALPTARTVLVASEIRSQGGARSRNDVDRVFVGPLDMGRIARAIERLLPHEAGHARDRPPGE